MAKLTEKELQDLKTKYGSIYTLTVPVNDDETEFATIYLRKMDRPCFSTVSKLVQKDALQGLENLIKTLWIGGDEATKITENFDALRAAEQPCLEILMAKQGTLKKN
jgi:hypothetical protein